MNSCWISAGAGATLWIACSAYVNIAAGPNLAVQIAGIFSRGAAVSAGTSRIVLMLVVAALAVALVAGFSGRASLRIRQLIRPVRGRVRWSLWRNQDQQHLIPYDKQEK